MVLNYFFKQNSLILQSGIRLLRYYLVWTKVGIISLSVLTNLVFLYRALILLKGIL